MRISDIPALLKGVFSEAGSKSAIPQTTPDPGRASYSLGFPPKTMTTLEDGGIPPDGRDMNGILFEVSQAALWQQVMGVLPFEAAFATAKGYPSGAMVQHGGHVWRSTIDDNNATPTAASAGWELMSASGGATGQVLMKASSKSGDFAWMTIGISDVFNLQSSLNGMQSSLNGKLAMGNSLPLGDGAASAGSSTSGSRQDHRHPTDTTRAPLESPALTGTPTAPTAAPGTNTKQLANTEFVITEVTTAVNGLGYGMFYKADPTTVAFTKTGDGTASIKAGTKVYVAGTVVTFAAATAITMPALTAGTDYAIWVKDDATIQATTNFSSAPGAGNWRKIGGFHYAPGGNAAAMGGGDTTPAINAYSFWDLKFRPACPDPRGMTLVADSFWADIYLLGVDHLTNGTSKYNVSIADGSAPPKIPTKFGGTGSNAYSFLNWWAANEVLQSWGKRSPTYDEFAALAYGTTEGAGSGGSDVPTTGVSGTGATNAWNKFTSRWGVIQATGCMWIWGGEFGGGASGISWTANTGGRGSTSQMENAVLLGGYWALTTQSGSLCSAWNYSATASDNTRGARGVSDHLTLV